MALTTVSNENKTRVDELVEKQTRLALQYLQKASTLMHDTGDVESEQLDQANSHLTKAIEKINYYLWCRDL